TLVYHVVPSTSVDMWMNSGGVVLGSSALMIAVFAFGRGGGSAWLGSRPMIFLGEVSFAIYLVHAIVIKYFLAHPAMVAGWPGGTALAAVIAGILLAATLLHFCVERPARAFLRSATPLESSPARVRPTVVTLAKRAKPSVMESHRAQA